MIAIFAHCAVFYMCLSSCSSDRSWCRWHTWHIYAPDKPRLWEKLEDPQFFRPHAKIKMTQVWDLVLPCILYLWSHGLARQKSVTRYMQAYKQHNAAGHQSDRSVSFVSIHLPDIIGRTALAVWPDVLRGDYTLLLSNFVLVITF